MEEFFVVKAKTIKLAGLMYHKLIKLKP